MKKYRIEDDAKIVDGMIWARGIKMTKTKMIVWVGASRYWTRVYLNETDHRLYIPMGHGHYEILDNCNIKKIEAMT
jgi:hypothetical protein